MILLRILPEKNIKASKYYDVALITRFRPVSLA